MRRARLYNQLTLVPGAWRFLKNGPLKFLKLSVHKYLSVYRLHILVRHRRYLLQAAKALAQFYVHFRTVAQHSSHGNVDVAVADRSVRNLVRDRQVRFGFPEYLPLIGGKSSTKDYGQGGNNRLP